MADTKGLRDAVIIGGGHNGLVCAAYLAAAGLEVTVLERRAVVGGAAVTEEFHPGFRNSVAAYTVSLLNPKIIRDLELPRHGLRVVERELSNFLPLHDGQFLKVGGGKTEREVAKFSERDASRLGAYAERLEAIADVLRDLVLETPPNVTAGGWLEALPQLLRTARSGKTARQARHGDAPRALGSVREIGGRLSRLLVRKRADQGCIRFRRHRRELCEPVYARAPLTCLLHHVFGEVNGKKGAWGHAIGGMGAITQAMSKAAAERGAEVRVSSPVREVLVESGRGRACSRNRARPCAPAA